jgi:hypothetical protein
MPIIIGSEGSGSGGGGVVAGGNINHITSISKLPAVTSGFIELDPSEQWSFEAASLDIPAGFKLLGPTSLFGQAATVQINHLTGGPLITGTDFFGLDVSGLTLNYPNGSLMDLRNVAFPASSIVRFLNVNNVQGDSLGSFENIFGLSLISFVVGFGGVNGQFKTGLTDNGTLTSFLTVLKAGSQSLEPTFVGFDFGDAAYDSLEITDWRFTGPVGSIALKGKPNGGNLQVGEIAKISSCEVKGGCAFLDGISPNDFRFKFDTCPPIPDSVQKGLLALISNATVTTMLQSTPTAIAGTWVVESAKQFTATTAGILTALFERTIDITIVADVNIAPVSGTNKDLAVYLAVDGSVIPDSKIETQADANSPQSLSFHWSAEVTEGQTLQLFVENESDGNGVLVSSSHLHVNS